MGRTSKRVIVEKVENKNIGDIFKSYYKDYGSYVLKYRALPDLVSSLRAAHRRILLSVYELTKGKSGFIKSSNVIGYCLQNYHPHGDVALNDVIRGLVGAGFLEGQGNFGSPREAIYNIPSAAQRYTEIKLTDFTKKLFFNYIDSVERIESENMPEPIHLSAIVPFCLIKWGMYSVPAFSKKSIIPSFTLESIFDFIIEGDCKNIKLLKPDIGLNVISVDKNIYTKGTGKIEAQMDFSYNNKDTFVVKQKPPIEGFRTLEKYLDKNYNLKVIDNSTSSGTNIEIFVKSNHKEEIKNLKKVLSSKYTYSIDMILWDFYNDKEVTIGVVDLIKNTISHYYKYRNDEISKKIDGLLRKLEEAVLLEKIKEGIKSKKIKIDNIDKFINDVSSYCKITKERSVEISKRYTIYSIVNCKNDIKKMEQEMLALKKTYENKSDFINELKDVRKSIIGK